jgi:predicted ATP-dependent serine protease
MTTDRLLEREGERVALVGALDDATAVSGRLVVIEGEPGLGKSALLALAGEGNSGAGRASRR